MVCFPNCKINLGLNIVGNRSDGFHDLETVFYPLQINDAVEVIENETIQFSTSGLAIDGNFENNLCVKAYQLLKKEFPQLPAIQMHLHKAIPMGAGLGGGSADGAFTLKLLDKKFNLSLSEKQLTEYAFQLGSDCSFFIINQPCFAKGRGERLERIDLQLLAFKIFLVYPGIYINTASAFSHIKPAVPKKSIKDIIQQPIETWKEELKNDFEISILVKHPNIKNIKDELYKAGAIYSSMSGSGSAVYGIFEKDKPLSFSFPRNYFVKELTS